MNLSMIVLAWMQSVSAPQCYIGYNPFKRRSTFTGQFTAFLLSGTYQYKAEPSKDQVFSAEICNLRHTDANWKQLDANMSDFAWSFQPPLSLSKQSCTFFWQADSTPLTWSRGEEIYLKASSGASRVPASDLCFIQGLSDCLQQLLELLRAEGSSRESTLPHLSYHAAQLTEK